MSVISEDDFDGSLFLRNCKVEPHRLEATGISEGELEDIVDDFKARRAQFQRNAQTVSDTLLQEAAGVHSVRYRVKDAYALGNKVIRKKAADNKRLITLKTYDEEITDLAGVRALHLFKNDWVAIHEFIVSTWDLKETPIVYYREGDSDEMLKIYREQNCELKAHPFGYRSAHYLIKTSITKKQAYVELQVRTIFEEGWSEVDHKIRYPEFSNDPLLNNLLMMLNRSAGAADEMSSFVQALKDYIKRTQREKAELGQKMQEVIDRLNIPKTDKTAIEGIARSLQQFSLQALPYIPSSHLEQLAKLDSYFPNIALESLFTPEFTQAMESISSQKPAILDALGQMPKETLDALKDSIQQSTSTRKLMPSKKKDTP